MAREAGSGLTFGIARPMGAPLREIRRASVRTLSLGLLVIGLALVGIVPISHRMTRHLTSLTHGVKQLAGGDFATRVQVQSTDEFGALAAAFNQMAEDLERNQALVVEKERLRREMELSRQIQTEMLPRTGLRLGAAEINGISIPAREVGGDFFNYFVLPDGRLALLVGDVSGKGVSAALLMANVQATLRARLPLETNLASLAAGLDREIDKTTPRGVFFTLFIGILESDGRTLRYVNAGHNPQFVVRGQWRLRRAVVDGTADRALPGSWLYRSGDRHPSRGPAVLLHRWSGRGRERSGRHVWRRTSAGDSGGESVIRNRVRAAACRADRPRFSRSARTDGRRDDDGAAARELTLKFPGNAQPPLLTCRSDRRIAMYFLQPRV